MFIKWKYNDHGHKDWQELEIHDDFLKDYNIEEECIFDYIINNCRIPVLSERYMPSRLKWEKITKTHAELQEIIKGKIDHLRLFIEAKNREMQELKEMLD